MTRLALLLLLASTAVPALGCGGASQPASMPPKLLHSPELNEIMKNEVNQPFSALMFLVFHAGDDGSGEEFDFAKVREPVMTLRTGISKVRAMLHPPVQTAEAREVFMTYVDSLVRDSDLLSQAFEGRNRPRMEQLLHKITNTCNDCHHFFRLKLVANGPPPPSVVMVEPAFMP
jgi:hypothetical protein